MINVEESFWTVPREEWSRLWVRVMWRDFSPIEHETTPHTVCVTLAELASRSVDALACHLTAPAHGLTLHVIAIQPALASKEVLADVLHLAFDVWLALGMARHGCVDHEAPVRGVLGEGPLE